MLCVRFVSGCGGISSVVRDVLLVVDVFSDFDHEDGDALLASFRERATAMVEAIAAARQAGTPVVYVNDQHGRWDGDAPGLVRAALSENQSGEVIAPLAPKPGDPFLLKARYSAFDHTPLVLSLRQLEIDRILLVGAATEGCIVQTGIDARELDFKVTIFADACATNDAALADVALGYAERVGGIRIDRAISGTA